MKETIQADKAAFVAALEKAKADIQNFKQQQPKRKAEVVNTKSSAAWLKGSK